MEENKKEPKSKKAEIITNVIYSILASVCAVFTIYYLILDHAPHTPYQESSTTSQNSTPYEEDNTNIQESTSYEEYSSEDQDFIISNISMDKIKNVIASSSLSEYNMVHSANRMIDGDISTAWVEGAPGQGIKESITLTFDNTYIITGFTIYAGYHKNEDLFLKNSRPKEISVIFSDGSSESHILKDLFKPQNIVLSQPVSTGYVTISIESVYPGNKFDDTIISEFSLY